MITLPLLQHFLGGGAFQGESVGVVRRDRDVVQVSVVGGRDRKGCAWVRGREGGIRKWEGMGVDVYSVVYLVCG